jgi:hypothetical protein
MRCIERTTSAFKRELYLDENSWTVQAHCFALPDAQEGLR